MVYRRPQSAAESVSSTPVVGDNSWDTTRTVLAFRPAATLAAGDYELVIEAAAKATNGASLARPYVAVFTVTGAGTHK